MTNKKEKINVAQDNESPAQFKGIAILSMMFLGVAGIVISFVNDKFLARFTMQKDENGEVYQSETIRLYIYHKIMAIGYLVFGIVMIFLETADIILKKFQIKWSPYNIFHAGFYMIFVFAIFIAVILIWKTNSMRKEIEDEMYLQNISKANGKFISFMKNTAFIIVSVGIVFCKRSITINWLICFGFLVIICSIYNFMILHFDKTEDEAVGADDID